MAKELISLGTAPLGEDGDTVRQAFTKVNANADELYAASDAAATKLATIATGATANATDAQLRDRATHTGTQAISTVSGLQGALDGKVGAGDSRLTDAREWTAETVSQAEAETGTATTRRAWTSERVRQAILGWWNGATSAFGRGFVAAADSAAGRTALELGSAATRNALGTTGDLYSRDSILGTVSQSAGIPTGAIIERGSNANGEYTKFADGTLICTTTVDLPPTAIYTQIDISKPHPHTFSVIDSVQYSAFGEVGSGGQSLVGIAYYNGIYTNVTSNANLAVRCFTYRAELTYPVRFYFTTHGRWY